MNKIFSRVWCRSRQQLVVASELAAAGGKKEGRRRLGNAALGAMTLTLGFALAPPPALAAETTDALAAANVEQACVAAVEGQEASAEQSGCADAQAVTPTAAVEDAYVKVDGAGDGSDDATMSGQGAIAIGSSSYATQNATTAVGSGSIAAGTSSMRSRSGHATFCCVCRRRRTRKRARKYGSARRRRSSA